MRKPAWMVAGLLLSLVARAAPPASSAPAPSPGAAPARETAIFAGGCFWCVESDFERIPGVLSAVSGYTGGKTENPTYKEVSRGGTGHKESVEVTFDPSKITYEQLLARFWRSVDPTDASGQFCDHGDQYQTAIFVNGDRQRKAAEASKAELEKSGRLKAPIVTAILPATRFYPAEDYHQDYYKKNPLRYRYYRFSCGRDARVKELWGSEAASAQH